MPKINRNYGLVRRNNEIIACGGMDDMDCYIYFITNNTWALLSSPGGSSPPYTVYNNMMYFSSSSDPAKVLDLATKEWSSWPAPPTNYADGCQVAWRDTFIRFGGGSNFQMVLEFNHTTQNWAVLTEQSPMQFYRSGCALISDDKVVLAGSAIGTSNTKFTIYDIKSKQWPFNGALSTETFLSTFVTLGSRVFMLRAMGSNLVHEFFPSNNTFMSLSYTIQVARQTGAVALSVPARLFRSILPTCTGV